jgi:gas vesicle protein
MTWFLIGLFAGAFIGFLGAAMLAVSARSDLLRELDDCHRRVRRLAE